MKKREKKTAEKAKYPDKLIIDKELIEDFIEDFRKNYPNFTIKQTFKEILKEDKSLELKLVKEYIEAFLGNEKSPKNGLSTLFRTKNLHRFCIFS